MDFNNYIFIFGFLVSLGLAEWTSREYPSSSFYFLHTRLWELLSGSILAYFEVSKGHRSNNKTLKLIYCSHTIVHLNDNFVLAFMKQAYKKLKKGGIIRLVCPDIDIFLDIIKS